MILLGISTQAHIDNLCLHFGSAGNQFLQKNPVPGDIWDFDHQLVKETGRFSKTEGHDLPAEETALRSDKHEQFVACSVVNLSEASALSHLGSESTLGNSFQGVLHAGDTPRMVLDLLIYLTIVNN